MGRMWITHMMKGSGDGFVTFLVCCVGWWDTRLKLTGAGMADCRRNSAQEELRESVTARGYDISQFKYRLLHNGLTAFALLLTLTDSCRQTRQNLTQFRQHHRLVSRSRISLSIRSPNTNTSIAAPRPHHLTLRRQSARPARLDIDYCSRARFIDPREDEFEVSWRGTRRTAAGWEVDI